MKIKCVHETDKKNKCAILTSKDCDGCSFKETKEHWDKRQAEFEERMEQKKKWRYKMSIGLTERNMDEIEKLARPLADYISKNLSPYATVCVTDSRVDVVRNECGIPLGDNPHND